MTKYLDENGLLYFWQQLKTLFSGKVDKVSGKGLSTNDYTTQEQTKLSGIATGAQVNVLEGITVNGTPVTPTNKIAAITTPTKTSDLTNDSGFITAADVPEGAVASTTTPKMDGTAEVGTETAFARGDHRHPTDTSRQAKITASGMLKGDGNGGVSAAVAGTDYQAPLTAGTDYQTPLVAGTDYQTPLAAGTDYVQPATLNSYLTSSVAETTYAKKTDISNAYIYRGSVAAYADLPSTGLTAGDVYDVQSDGMNYAWNGTTWDQLGATFSITSITNAEIDAILAA